MPPRAQALWNYLDDSQWWSTLDFLRPAELQAGDVLITKNYKMSAAASGTVWGQRFGSWMRQSSGYSTHAMLYTGNFGGLEEDDEPKVIAHCSSGNQWQGFQKARTYTKKPNLVFRPNDVDLGRAASRNGIFICGYDPENGASRMRIIEPTPAEVQAHNDRVMAQLEGNGLTNPADLQAPAPRTEGFVAGSYTAGGRKKSVFKMKFKGDKARNWIEAVRRNDLGEAGPPNTQTIGTALFCSSFVALCYELEGNILNVDPRAMSVKALESMLNRSAAFELIGRTWIWASDADPLNPCTTEVQTGAQAFDFFDFDQADLDG